MIGNHIILSDGNYCVFLISGIHGNTDKLLTLCKKNFLFKYSILILGAPMRPGGKQPPKTLPLIHTVKEDPDMPDSDIIVSSYRQLIILRK